MYAAEKTSRGARAEDGEAVEARSGALPSAELRSVRRPRGELVRERSERDSPRKSVKKVRKSFFDRLIVSRFARFARARASEARSTVKSRENSS